MNIRYKLTNQNLKTYNSCQWTLGEWKETNGIGSLCTKGWLHCYSNPLLAILLNPVHAMIKNPKLFECEVEGKCLEDRGMKEGWTRMRLVKEIPLPEISLTQKAAFGILCAKKVCEEETWVNWANNWLNGTDRTGKSATTVVTAVAADYVVAYYAAEAVNAAVNAAVYAASANYAAYYAANAANAAANVTNTKNLGLIQLANQAMKY